ncbi:PREDICTED: SUN domain-containing protein 2 [Tinamus guttatus]|uniref:SUN domain-containing protein 2 n=1 Tax=Tinamus guttatus TaxID=94827 RepID=UPI00052F3D0D|nr:PREDICTED: SUN domain-containing protein 2 [Tinamus guttatus]
MGHRQPPGPTALLKAHKCFLTSGRTVRRKSSSMKRLSPGPSTQTSYYSESMMSESYLGGSRGLPALGSLTFEDSLGDSRALPALGSLTFDDGLDGSSFWGGELSTRRRRGTGDTESSKTNGLVESKTYDTYASSSGYSSEDDYASHFSSGQSSSGSGLRGAASQVGSFLWHVITSPVRFLGWLLSWVRAAWRRLTGTAAPMDGVASRRGYSALKKFLLLLLLLLLLAVVAYGAWYFYPYGLSTLSFSAFSWGSAKVSSSGGADMQGARDLTALDQGLSREQQLLARFQALETDPPGELDALRAQVRMDLDGRLGKVTQASQEMEARLLKLNSEWQSSAQDSLRGSFQKEMDKLERELAGLKRELALLKSDQEVVGKHMEVMLEQIKGVRTDVEAQVPAWISRFLSQPRQEGAASLFLQREDLQAELQALERKILAKVLEDRRLSARDAQAGIGVALRQGGMAGVTEEQVHLIVSQALQRYSEDRVGMVDYALESAGASVINTRCSETYETKTALLSLFGIPLWYHSQSPRVILQPDVNPGNCWAFRGSQGFAVIRLSSPIRPTAVTLEHIPRNLSPQGTIPSAPKDFTVYGLKEEREEEGTLLGQFMYNHDGDPIQTFYLKGEDLGTFQLVELRILSNWGHPEYTCIYRFRVHGEPVH